MFSVRYLVLICLTAVNSLDSGYGVPPDADDGGEFKNCTHPNCMDLEILLLVMDEPM